MDGIYLLLLGVLYGVTQLLIAALRRIGGAP